MPLKLTNEVAAAAIEGLTAQRKRIDDQIAELRAMIAGEPTNDDNVQAEPRGRGRRRMSAAARARIAAAQRARWAAQKGESQPATPAAAPKKKRKMSAEGRARIIAATKARWARVRAEKKRVAK